MKPPATHNDARVMITLAAHHIEQASISNEREFLRETKEHLRQAGKSVRRARKLMRRIPKPTTKGEPNAETG
jgi:hypothetical protein